MSTRGSHCKLRNKAEARTVIVPLHRELAPGPGSRWSNAATSSGPSLRPWCCPRPMNRRTVLTRIAWP
nr:type II toxin-antitoxin system HicA family toxin [Frankia sp. Cas4]